MSKHIAPNELAEIVTALLVQPELVGELVTSDQHRAFLLKIGEVVCDFCGGEVNWITPPDFESPYLTNSHTIPYLSVAANDCLPDPYNNVWTAYDPSGWEDDIPVNSIKDNAVLFDTASTKRHVIQQLLIEKSSAWEEP